MSGFIVSGDGPRPFKCPHCPSEFKWGSQLQEHLASDHPAPQRRSKPPPICPHCNKTFSSNSARNAHIQRLCLKDDVDGNRCPHCGVVFRFVAQLQKHLEGHEDPSRALVSYRCPCCPRAFLEKYYLKLHIRAVHLDAGHKCPVPGCRHSSIHRRDLESHLKTHETKNFKCGRCSKAAYKSEKGLKTHVAKVHGDEDVEVPKIEEDEVPKIEEDAEVPKIVSVVSLGEEIY